MILEEIIPSFESKGVGTSPTVAGVHPYGVVMYFAKFLGCLWFVSTAAASIRLYKESGVTATFPASVSSKILVPWTFALICPRSS
eukprot:964722-Heterocapsa_arctica.AAC.1